MIQYPLQFNVETSASSGMQNAWQTSVPQQKPLSVAVPPEFEGPGGGYSPEDLYALALLNCYAATFKVIAEKSRLEFASLGLSGILTVDRDEKGVPWMKQFSVQVKLRGCADGERGRRLMEKTSQSCMILNSVRTEKSFEFSVES